MREKSKEYLFSPCRKAVLSDVVVVVRRGGDLKKRMRGDKSRWRGNRHQRRGSIKEPDDLGKPPRYPNNCNRYEARHSAMMQKVYPSHNKGLHKHGRVK